MTEARDDDGLDERGGGKFREGSDTGCVLEGCMLYLLEFWAETQW